MGRVNLSLALNEYAYADAYANADANAYAYANADAYADADAYANANAYADADAYADAYAADAYADADAYAADAYADAYAYAYAYAYADADAGHSMKFLADQTAENGVVYAFYKSNADGSPSNGGSGTIATPGAIHECAGPLEICTKNALHATLDLNSWKGSKLWLVKMFEPIEYQNDGSKIGSLRREIVCEL